MNSFNIESLFLSTSLYKEIDFPTNYLTIFPDFFIDPIDQLQFDCFCINCKKVAPLNVAIATFETLTIQAVSLKHFMRESLKYIGMSFQHNLNFHVKEIEHINIQ
ncbi:hypothetical protein C6351_17725 [Bacillus thuringiensis]|nr:hypothetical protein C6351_17725 [Bacillus thuringiensis]